MISKASVDNFLGQEHIALAGYSRDTKKFGHVVYKTLNEKSYTLYPVNPFGGTAPGGETIYTDVEALPEAVKALLVVTKPDITKGVVEKALSNGFEHIWIQQMSGDKQLYEALAQQDVNVVCGSCILLHAQPTGIHKFHRWLVGLVGKLPR
jgi:predicted CoA-binding protein